MYIYRLVTFVFRSSLSRSTCLPDHFDSSCGKQNAAVAR